MIKIVLSLFIIFLQYVNGFYLPGLSPVNFCEADNVKSNCQVRFFIIH